MQVRPPTDDEMAAVAALHTAAAEAGGARAYDPERDGVGSAVLAHLEGYAAAAGCAELTLQSSLNAVGFYERAGYERVGDGESPGGIAVVEMQKRL